MRRLLFGVVIILIACAGNRALWGQELRPQVLHDGSQITAEEALRMTDGAVKLRADGRESYMHSDDGSFAWLHTTAANWRFTARVAAAPEGTDNPKYGIAVREGLGPQERGLHLRYDGYGGNRCIQWFFRHLTAQGTHHGVRRVFIDGVERDMAAQEGFWLRLERRYPRFYGSYSLDGEEWRPIAGDYSLSLLQQEVYVGLMLTAGADGRRPVEATFDAISFQELDAPELTQEDFQPHIAPDPRWEMFSVHVPVRGERHHYFVMKPVAMPWEDLRGLLYSAGSKEVVVRGDTGQLIPLAYDYGEERLRKPSAMPDWDGHWQMPALDPIYHMYAQQGLARIGGAGHPSGLAEAIELLVEKTGFAGLRHLPMAVSGMSFAGGWTHTTTTLYPERIVAAAPTHLGPVGWQTEDERLHRMPRLYVSGSHDGSHLRDFIAASKPIRERGSLWGIAPMWWYYHVLGHTQSIVLPYFFRCFDLRLPETLDTSAAVPLAELAEESGWLGLHDSWESSDPQIVAWDDASAEQRRGGNSWFPDEFTATVWRAAVSNWPRTIIHFPRFDPNDGWSGPPAAGHVHHQLRAGEPFRILASGPLADDLQLRWFSGLEELAVESDPQQPYQPLLPQGLSPGVHVLYAITEWQGRREISRPQLILVHPQ